jgi:hypothetical protein
MALSLALTTLLGACRSAPSKVDYARPFPALAQQGSVNVQVVRKVTKIELTNTTARDFGSSTLWINSRFARPVPSFKVGETLTLDLREFRDEHNDAFRAGGFFAAEPPDTVALVQIETAGAEGKPELVGFVVVGGEE